MEPSQIFKENTSLSLNLQVLAVTYTGVFFLQKIGVRYDPSGLQWISLYHKLVFMVIIYSKDGFLSILQPFSGWEKGCASI